MWIVVTIHISLAQALFIYQTQVGTTIRLQMLIGGRRAQLFLPGLYMALASTCK